jgi:hypothetical protein
MPGGHIIHSPSPGSLEQRTELYLRVAKDARIRGLALEIFADEIGDDRLGEFAFNIEDVKGNLELVGDLPCIFNRGRGTTGASPFLLLIWLLRWPKTKGDPYDFISPLLQ